MAKLEIDTGLIPEGKYVARIRGMSAPSVHADKARLTIATQDVVGGHSLFVHLWSDWPGITLEMLWKSRKFWIGRKLILNVKHKKYQDRIFVTTSIIDFVQEESEEES